MNVVEFGEGKALRLYLSATKCTRVLGTISRFMPVKDLSKGACSTVPKENYMPIKEGYTLGFVRHSRHTKSRTKFV